MADPLACQFLMGFLSTRRVATSAPAKTQTDMNSTLRSKQQRLSVALAIIVPLVLVSLGYLGAQQPSAITLPLKVDSDLSGISLELTSVQKTSDTITIRFKYNNTGDKSVRIDKEANQQVSDMYYVDAKNKKKYPIVKDTQGKPLSSNLDYLEVGAGETKAGWAKFPAPPPDVTTISVYIPGAPPFENVPVAP